jgi:hypothetical protein
MLTDRLQFDLSNIYRGQPWLKIVDPPSTNHAAAESSIHYSEAP